MVSGFGSKVNGFGLNLRFRTASNYSSHVPFCWLVVLKYADGSSVVAERATPLC